MQQGVQLSRQARLKDLDPTLFHDDPLGVRPRQDHETAAAPERGILRKSAQYLCLLAAHHIRCALRIRACKPRRNGNFVTAGGDSRQRSTQGARIGRAGEIGSFSPAVARAHHARKKDGHGPVLATPRFDQMEERTLGARLELADARARLLIHNVV
jgi:hypothetical protein